MKLTRRVWAILWLALLSMTWLPSPVLGKQDTETPQATNTSDSALTYAKQLAQVNAYFKALDRVSLKGSTIADIDALLSLMHEDVKYIHVEYHANFDRETWRKAFIRNWKRGDYQDTEQEIIRVTDQIYGQSHIAIEYARGELQSDESWVSEEPRLALFGFKEGKISLIKEYW